MANNLYSLYSNTAVKALKVYSWSIYLSNGILTIRYPDIDSLYEIKVTRRTWMVVNMKEKRFKSQVKIKFLLWFIKVFDHDVYHFMFC